MAALGANYHMAMLLEGFLLGGPLLFMVGSQPTAAFLVQALVVILVCLPIPGPMFLPKVYKRSTTENPDGHSFGQLIVEGAPCRVVV